MKNIEDNSIETCITDPPYNYEFAGQHWDNNEIKRRIKHAKASPAGKTLVANMPGSRLAGGKRNARWYQKNRENIIEEKVKNTDQLVTIKDIKDNSLVLQKGKKTFLKVNFE